MYMHLCVCIYSTKQVYYYTKCVCVYLRILPLLRKKTSKRRPKIWDPTPLKIARQYSRSEPRAGREVGSFSREREIVCVCVCEIREEMERSHGEFSGRKDQLCHHSLKTHI